MTPGKRALQEILKLLKEAGWDNPSPSAAEGEEEAARRPADPKLTARWPWLEEANAERRQWHADRHRRRLRVAIFVVGMAAYAAAWWWLATRLGR